jgi:hypothetical protein
MGVALLVLTVLVGSVSAQLHALTSQDADVNTTSDGTEALITLIVPYYNQHKLIYDQFKRWSDYPVEVQRKMEVVIVDDGSQRQPLETVFQQAKDAGDLPKHMPVLAVTLDKDIGFNHGGACNTVRGRL